MKYRTLLSYNTLQMRNNSRKGLFRFVTTHISKEVKPFNSIPGLSSIPYLGPVHHFLPLIGEIGPHGLFDRLDRLHAKYGPVMKMAGVFEKGNFVILFEPEQFEQVYKAEETSPFRPGFETLAYYREEMKQSIFQGVYGLLTAQDSKWREFRTKVNPVLLKPQLIKLYASGLEDIAEEAVTRIVKLKDQKEYLQKNFELEITKWSLESVGLVGLGARLGCFLDDLTEDHPARKLIKAARDISDLVFKLEFLPSPWRYIATPNFKKIVQSFETQWDLSSAYLKDTMKEINSRGYDIPDKDKSIIEKLLAIDEKVAIMMANEMLLAGIDTVAFATMSLLYQLAVNPNAQENLREEILSGTSNKYLRACLKESLRIYHVIPANIRRVGKDHEVGGYHIPKGVDVIAPNQYLSNHEKYYPRAKEFLPERWLADKTDPLYHGNAHPMVNLPFGYGIRSCIGRRIAELEIELLMKKLLKEVKVTWEGGPLKVGTKLLNEMEKPYRIKIESLK